MHFLLREIPTYLKEKINVLQQVVFSAIFALVFINIYSPFNAESWFDAGEVEFFFYSSLYILAGMLFILISRLVFVAIAKKRRINFIVYVLWTTQEILLLAVVYTLMDIYLLDNSGHIVATYIKLLFATLFVLAIPYSISWLWYSWNDQKRQLSELSQATSQEYSTKKLINFYDESNKRRFSVNSADVLYLESTDNYVTIFYEDKDKIRKFMLRNTMKKLEKELEKTQIRRCHRSFMVNFENVKMVRLSGTSLYIYLETFEDLKIPVSRTFAEKVHEFINTLSL
jgi:DNA-binding LytR/AlgR family response regulator